MERTTGTRGLGKGEAKMRLSVRSEFEDEADLLDALAGCLGWGGSHQRSRESLVGGDGGTEWTAEAAGAASAKAAEEQTARAQAAATEVRARAEAIARTQAEAVAAARAQETAARAQADARAQFWAEEAARAEAVTEA